MWCYARADFQCARKLLDQTNWNSLCADSSDVNQFWIAWHSRFCNIMEQCIPRKVLPAQKNLPWLNSDLLQAIRKRNVLFRAYKHTGSVNKLIQYKTLRNTISAIRYAKRKFLNNLHHVDHKSFWRMIKSLFKQNGSIPTLTCEGIDITTDTDKADRLNNQFFKNFNLSQPSLLSSYASFLNADLYKCP